MRRSPREEPVRITSATRARSADIDRRQRRYLISMAIRTVCFVLTIATFPHWTMWFFLAGAVFLPYVAVVVANGGAAPDPGGPDAFDASGEFKALGPGAADRA